MRIVKRSAEALLSSHWAGLVGRARLRHKTLILAYHNVIQDDSPRTGEVALHLPVSRFRAQMQLLVSKYEVISLSTLFSEPDAPGPRAVVTFDDAYVGSLTLADRVLRELGIPWALFVAPGLLGTGVPWWDLAAVGGEIPLGIRDRALRQLAGDRERVLEWLSSDVAQDHLPRELRIATESELQTLLRSSRVEIGAHSWSHAALTCVAAQELSDELRRSREWLASCRLPTINAVAYPYGMASSREGRLALELGFDAGFCIRGGLARGAIRGSAFVPRFAVPSGLSIAGWEARLNGFLL